MNLVVSLVAVAVDLGALARWLLVALVVMVASWGVLIVLARRLPPGTARDLAAFLPACATTMRRLRRHPAVPRRARWLVVFALLWVLSPIDLIPEFLPVIGPLDDVVVVALVLRYAARLVPPEVLFEAWPADPALLARLIGRQPPTATAVATFAPRTDGVVTIRPPEPADHEVLRVGPGVDPPTACIVVEGRVVGWIEYETAGSWLRPGDVDVSYTVFPSAQRQGFATRALELMIGHLRDETRFERATLLIDPANAGSLGVARRGAFTRVDGGDVDGFQLFERPVKLPEPN